MLTEIIKELGLEEKTEFKQNWNYLKPLFGFVSSRKASNYKTNIALEYEYRVAKKQADEEKGKIRPLIDFE